jgi:predicted nuclease of restriction endonuclease-like (RecB) superfamily
MAAKTRNSLTAKTPVLSKDENSFMADVSVILLESRARAYAAVNFAMTAAYWEVGKRIVEQEQCGKEWANYGEYLLTNLSSYLNRHFGKGFSYANLRNFRQFYLTFPDNEICYTLCIKLSWSHIRLIMRLDSEEARHYYLAEAREQNWSVRVLERNLKSKYYERLLSIQKKAAVRVNLPRSKDADKLIKDPYVLEFLRIPENYAGNESRLESAVIGHLQEFLLEMGRGFSFVGRQFRISTETSHFYIALVFYNYLLKYFVIIDLKTQKLTHQDIGQMDMYVRMFDDLKRGQDDNPTIGIILCADKDETIVKYSVLEESRRIFASKYKVILPVEEELAAELERNARYLRETGGDR